MIPEAVTRRLERAQEHLDSIREEAHAYSETRPYTPVIEREDVLYALAAHSDLVPEGDRQDLVPEELRPRWDDMAMGIVVGSVEPPPVRLSILAGDVIHSVRSALDNLAWELVLRRSERPPVSAITRARRSNGRWEPMTAFPILKRQPTRRADGLPEESLLWPRTDLETEAVLDVLQPYKSPQPEEHPLAVIQSMSNSDKHQSIPLLMAYTGAVRTTVEFPNHEIVGLWADTIFVCSDGRFRQQPLAPGTAIGSVRLRDAIERLRRWPGEMKVNAEVSVVVSLSEPSAHDTPTEPMADRLQSLLDFVRDTTLPALAPLLSNGSVMVDQAIEVDPRST